MTARMLPLQDLFNRLREAGLPLGVDNYMQLVRALQAGFGLPKRAHLARLCRILWVKSKEEERLFNFHFEQVMALMPQTVEPQVPAQMDGRQPDSVEPPPLQPVQPQPALTAPLLDTMIKTEGEARAVQAILQPATDSLLPDASRLLRTLEYFPVTPRQMKQTWRHFRFRLREGPPVELDVEATINRVAREGVLLEPVLVPRRVNRARLILLLDQEGSMVPFHALSRRLSETAVRGGRFGRVYVYYFHNCPVDHLYQDSTLVKAEEVEHVLNGLPPDRASVLIFSDAGAARGGLNMERIEMTNKFISRVRRDVRRIAWLNPIPANRWMGTTAYDIARLVPMYAISRHGMDEAVGVLRGKRAGARGHLK
jgi:uncharacterized protein